jgi:hypothetical protein
LGALAGEPWNSFDPILSAVQLLDWALLGFPVLSDVEVNTWSGKRRVPPLGQYQLGMDIPLRYERLSPQIEGGRRVRSSGLVQRRGLQVAPDFRGTLQLDLRGEVDLEPTGRLSGVQLELAMRFEADSGSLVSSKHLARIRCRDCGGDINSPSEGPDNAKE